MYLLKELYVTSKQIIKKEMKEPNVLKLSQPLLSQSFVQQQIRISHILIPSSFSILNSDHKQVIILYGGHTNTNDWGWTNALRKYNIDTNTWGTLPMKFDSGSKLSTFYGKGIVKSTLVEHNEYIYQFGGIQGFSYHCRPWLYTYTKGLWKWPLKVSGPLDCFRIEGQNFTGPSSISQLLYRLWKKEFDFTYCKSIVYTQSL